jgi:hypothetical protein
MNELMNKLYDLEIIIKEQQEIILEQKKIIERIEGMVDALDNKYGG